jgi:hypothetical protein
VAEWIKAAVLKTAGGVSLSWVRIPPSPFILNQLCVKTALQAESSVMLQISSKYRFLSLKAFTSSLPRVPCASALRGEKHGAGVALG